jgi:ribonuclease J
LIVVLTLDKQRGCVVSGPDIVSRGFVYVRDAEVLIKEARGVVKEVLDRCESRQITEWSPIKTSIREALGKYLLNKTGRKPMILPIIIEI